MAVRDGEDTAGIGDRDNKSSSSPNEKAEDGECEDEDEEDGVDNEADGVDNEARYAEDAETADDDTTADLKEDTGTGVDEEEEEEDDEEEAEVAEAEAEKTAGDGDDGTKFISRKISSTVLEANGDGFEFTTADVVIGAVADVVVGAVAGDNDAIVLLNAAFVLVCGTDAGCWCCEGVINKSNCAFSSSFIVSAEFSRELV